jgi:hypothetical protein
MDGFRFLVFASDVVACSREAKALKLKTGAFSDLMPWYRKRLWMASN